MIQIQMTLFSTTGKYKPISTIMDVNSVRDFNQNRSSYKRKALERICARRYWGTDDLNRYGYTDWKYRIYDKEKIEKERVERYSQIKKERGWE